MSQAARTEWLALKEQARLDGIAQRKADRAKQRRLKDCKPLYRASKELALGMAELKRQRERDGAR